MLTASIEKALFAVLEWNIADVPVTVVYEENIAASLPAEEIGSHDPALIIIHGHRIFSLWLINKPYCLFGFHRQISGVWCNHEHGIESAWIECFIALLTEIQ